MTILRPFFSFHLDPQSQSVTLQPLKIIKLGSLYAYQTMFDLFKKELQLTV